MRAIPLLIMLALPMVHGCSRNQIGDLFRSFEDGDPGDDGFGGGGLNNPNGAWGLYALEPGMVFSSGSPKLLATYPEDGSVGADVSGLIVLRFDESLNPDETKLKQGIAVRRVSDGFSATIAIPST